MKRILLTLTLALLTSAAFAVDIGKPAPDFTAKDIFGKEHKLSDYKGKIVVLESYNLDCPYCRNHYKTGATQELQAAMTGKGVVWLLVNSVNPNHQSHRSADEAQKEWAREKIKATAWLDDSSGAIGRAYGMKTTPDMFVIDKEGNLAYQGAIDNRARSSGDPRTARNYVKEALNDLLAGKKIEVTETKSYGCSVKY